MVEPVTQPTTVAYRTTKYNANIECDGDTVSYDDWSEDAEAVRDAAVAIARYDLDAVVVGESKLVNDGHVTVNKRTSIIIEDSDGDVVRATDVTEIEDLVNAAHHLR